MAFTKTTWARGSQGQDVEGPGRAWRYDSSADAMATIIASGYFNDVSKFLNNGDYIHVIASDDEATLKVTSADLAAVVTTAVQVPAVLYGKHSDGGGSATVAVTATGVTATSTVFAQLEASTNAVNVQKVTPTANTITVLLSADPGAATIVSWQALGK